MQYMQYSNNSTTHIFGTYISMSKWKWKFCMWKWKFWMYKECKDNLCDHCVMTVTPGEWIGRSTLLNTQRILQFCAIFWPPQRKMQFCTIFLTPQRIYMCHVLWWNSMKNMISMVKWSDILSSRHMLDHKVAMATKKLAPPTCATRKYHQLILLGTTRYCTGRQ